MTQWDTDESGNIAVFPCVAFSTAVFMRGMNGGLRIEYATDPSLKNTASNQIIITAAQAREISTSLSRLADEMEKQLAADKPKGPIS